VQASILFLHHGTEFFAHRQAYPTQKLYYDSQLEPKRYRGLSKDAQVKKQLKKECFERKYRKTTYVGKETRWFVALEIKALRARILTNQAILRLGAS
jgi:hypothetical protein